MYQSRNVSGRRLKELKRKDEIMNDMPGLFSKTARITCITNISDVNKSCTWEEVTGTLENPSDIAPRPVWIDFQGMEDEDMKKIETYFRLHPLTIEDCLIEDTREKFEVFEGYLFVVINEIHYIEYSNILNNVNLCIVVFPNVVLSFHYAPVQTMHEVLHKLNFEVQGDIPSAEWLLYALIDGVVDIYVTLVDQVVREADSLDGLVLLLSGVDQTELLERIGYANRHAGHLKNGLFSKKEILATMKGSERIGSSVKLYVQNVTDHVVRCNQKLKLALETLGSLNTLYLAKVSIELAVASNHMNVIMRRLSALSAIFLPLTLISGIMGMNVRVPGMIGFPDTPSGYGWFIGILLFMVLLGMAIASFFKWKRWL